MSFSDALVVLALDAGVNGLADHAAVTPPGRPLTEKLTFPANDPPVTAVNRIVTEPPAAIVADCTTDNKASVAEPEVQLGFQPSTSSAPSTDPRPVARL